MRVLSIVAVAACGSSAKPAPVAPAPPPAPPTVAAAAPEPAPPPAPPPELPKEQPKDGPPMVARGGDPCEGGEVTGSGGLGLRGTGAGGGGTGEGTIGLGNLGRIGHGSGTGSSGGGYGAGTGGLRGRTAQPPNVKLGQQTVKGQLDTAIVRRIVRRHLNEIRYCFEKELVQNPGLAGDVTLTFTIGADGQVTKATSSTKFNKNVEGCMVARVKTWEFPKPKSGAVDVSYPFSFSVSTEP